jgi:hypothetical protein
MPSDVIRFGLELNLEGRGAGVKQRHNVNAFLAYGSVPISDADISDVLLTKDLKVLIEQIHWNEIMPFRQIERVKLGPKQATDLADAQVFWTRTLETGSGVVESERVGISIFGSELVVNSTISNIKQQEVVDSVTWLYHG